jgi:uncharacterized protein (TIRG00374 family)
VTIPWKKIISGIIIGMVVFSAFGIYADFAKLSEFISSFNYCLLLPILILSLLNYFIRFLKWMYFLKILDISCPGLLSLQIFISGFTMGITPGKVGELLKAYMLKLAVSTPFHKGAPIVITERITDMIALIFLCIFPILGINMGYDILAAGFIITAGVIIALRSRRIVNILGKFSLRIIRKDKAAIQNNFGDFYSCQERLLGIKPVIFGTFLSSLAWSAEAAGLYLTASGFGIDISPANAVFIYSLSTLAGAVSMLPGGLIFTEGSMTALLMSRIGNVPSLPMAVSITLIIRLCTLWFAVILGIAAVLIWNRRFRT